MNSGVTEGVRWVRSHRPRGKNLLFICRYEWRTSLGSIFQNLAVDYLLMISYNQECHIETKVNYLCAFPI